MGDFSLEINQKATYLHVVVTGKNSKENVENYLKEILRECVARNCSKVLIEEHLKDHDWELSMFILLLLRELSKLSVN